MLFNSDIILVAAGKLSKYHLHAQVIIESFSKKKA